MKCMDTLTVNGISRMEIVVDYIIGVVSKVPILKFLFTIRMDVLHMQLSAIVVITIIYYLYTVCSST